MEVRLTGMILQLRSVSIWRSSWRTIKPGLHVVQGTERELADAARLSSLRKMSSTALKTSLKVAILATPGLSLASRFFRRLRRRPRAAAGRRLRPRSHMRLTLSSGAAPAPLCSCMRESRAQASDPPPAATRPAGAARHPRHLLRGGSAWLAGGSVHVHELREGLLREGLW